MIYRSAAFTDTGKVRRDNQDRYLNDASLGLFGVADGVGGLPHGADAAQCAVDTVRDSVTTAGHAEPDLRAIVHRANTAVGELGERISSHTGIATTLTIALIRDDSLRLAHVGDSRCYLFRGEEITCLTEDDTMENEARRRRARGELIFIGEYQRNALSQCIGQPQPPVVALSVHPLQPGDRVLFASDGITRLIHDPELRDFLARARTPGEVTQQLVDEANQRGGIDNATAVAIFVPATRKP